MSITSDGEILEVRGNFRVRLETDENSEKPYNEGSTPIIEFSYRTILDPTFLDNTGAYISASEKNHIREAASHFRTEPDLFERYLRIFHGVTTVKWYESQDSKYVTFDTADWRKHHGITDEAIKPVIDQDYLNSVNLDEWQAYVEGDVYGYILEERNTWTRTSPLNASNGTTPDTMETWEEIESTWGFYGYDYAKEAAMEALTEEVSERTTTTTEYHKYPLPLINPSNRTNPS